MIGSSPWLELVRDTRTILEGTVVFVLSIYKIKTHANEQIRRMCTQDRLSSFVALAHNDAFCTGTLLQFYPDIAN